MSRDVPRGCDPSRLAGLLGILSHPSPDIRALANRAYALLKDDPKHPSLHFKKIDVFWSVRVGIHYRALGMDVKDGILWFWIGSHAEYDRITS